jgi:hypothetical protein
LGVGVKSAHIALMLWGTVSAPFGDFVPVWRLQIANLKTCRAVTICAGLLPVRGNKYPGRVKRLAAVGQMSRSIG